MRNNFGYVVKEPVIQRIGYQVYRDTLPEEDLQHI